MSITKRKPLLHLDLSFPKHGLGGYGPIEFGMDIPNTCIKQVGHNFLTGEARFVIYSHLDRREHLAKLQGLIRKDNVRVVRCMYDVKTWQESGVGNGDLQEVVKSGGAHD